MNAASHAMKPGNDVQSDAPVAMEVVRLDLRDVPEKLLRATSQRDSLTTSLEVIEEQIAQLISPVLIHYFDSSTGRGISPESTYHQTADLLLRVEHTAIVAACQSAIQQQCQQARRSNNDPGGIIVAAPVYGPNRAVDAVALVFSAGSLAEESRCSLLQVVAAHLTLLHSLSPVSAIEAENRTLAAVLELLAKLGRCADAHQAFTTVVAELRLYLAAQSVVLGFCSGAQRNCEVQAISGIADFKSDAELVRHLESTLDEALIRNTVTTWPPSLETERHSALAHQRLCAQTGCKALVTVPLRDDRGGAVGTLAVLLPHDLSQRPETLPFVRACETSLGACLWRWKQAGRSWRARVTETVRQKFKARRVAILLGAAGMLFMLLAMPVRYKVSCSATVQPATRRFVVAPFDAKLERALVGPGDVVSAGEVLALLDGRELRLEVASLTADVNRASKQSDAALATHNVAEAQQAQLEMERLNLKIRLLEQRMQQLEIKAPLAGVIASGDLRKAEGAPLSLGQSLFEVAPLEQMVVELSVPEDDIAYVVEGSEVTVRLDAYAGEPWTGTVTRIHPRSEIRDQRTVFVVEVMFDNTSAMLRPGMQGSAKIVGPPATLAWSWFHKPWHRLKAALSW